MKHVRQIRGLIDQGELTEAQQALDELLSLGPGNLEALKLRAMLYGYEGRFHEEARAWEEVFGQDGEDADAIMYFHHRHLEDRESLYFTDPTQEGGRRFYAYPRQTINALVSGLIGCLIFLGLHSCTDRPALGESGAMISFGVLVIAPWLWIGVAYSRALRQVTLDTQGIEISSRFRNLVVPWAQVLEVYLTHDAKKDPGNLALLIMPRLTGQPIIELDLSRDKSAIRARGLFILEIERLFHAPVIRERGSLTGLGSLQIRQF